MKKLILSLGAFFFICNAFSITYFVSPQGNDSHTGTLFYPVKTIQVAVDKAKPGDNVVVLPGLYKQHVVIRNKKGSSDTPFVLSARGDVKIVAPDNIARTEKSAIIQGKEEETSDPLHPFYPYHLGSIIRAEYSSNVVIEGFYLQDSPWMGISCLGCENITVQNNRIDRTMSSGIYMLWSKNVTVLHNEITRACGYPVRVSAGGPQGHGTQEFLSIVSCDGFEVAYNSVHESYIYSWTEGGGTGSGGEGIDVKEHSANGSVHHNHVYNLKRLGLYCDAWNAPNFRNVEVYNNVVHDCLNGIGVGAEDGGTVRNIRFYNNLVFNITWQGMALASWGHNGEKINIWIFNNLFHNCEMGAISLGDDLQDSIYVMNNICFENGRGSSRHGKMENADLNVGKAKNVVVKTNILGENPGFTDVSTYNYRLKKESKAIDAGSRVETFGLDLDNLPRVSGKSIDIGPFEYQK